MKKGYKIWGYDSFMVFCSYAFILTLLGVSFNGISQESDSVELKPVIVSAESPTGIPALKSATIDDKMLFLSKNENLGTVLQNYSPVFIKDYGSNGIQTVTFRGMGASHTKIFLNGLDISPASLGQSDLSIIPTFLFGGVDVKYGNAAYTEGAGAIGGGVMLNSGSNDLQLGPSVLVGFAAGSFEKRVFTSQFGYKTKKTESITRYIVQVSTNDFPYRNIAQVGSPIMNQSHSEGELHGFSQSINHQLNTNNSLSFVALGTFSNRELPGLMTDYSESVQTQNDILISTQLGWKKYGKKSTSNLKVGYSWSDLVYKDPASNINSSTINQKIQLREDYNRSLFKNWALKSTALVQYASATNNNLDGTQGLFQASVLASVNGHLSKKWEVGGAIQPTMNGNEFRLLPMASVAFLPKGKSNFIIGANVAKNAHFPTLNDLYWSPGGNPDLLPEDALNMELNAHIDGKVSVIDWDFDATGFYGQVDNWILWQPTDKAYWEAQNIKSVEHSGGEVFIKLKYSKKYWKFIFNTSYQYVSAVNKGVTDNSLNKQLIYTPEHSANWWLGAQYKRIHFNVNYNFTGKRYITSTNSDWLPAYDLVNITASYQLLFNRKNHIDFQLDVNNVLGKEYMSVAYRAMPGTNFQFSVRYNFGLKTEEIYHSKRTITPAF